MRSSRKATLAIVFAVSTAWAPVAGAQQTPQGFALERFYSSAPGGGWLVMDSLDMHGGLGGAVSFTTGYAHDPLRVTDGVNHLSVVADQAFAEIGMAATYDRFRLYLNLDSPLVVQGQSGAVGGYQYLAPGVDPGSNPDTISDARFGFDARFLGEPGGPFRLGAGAQLIVSSGNRGDYASNVPADYLTDGTFRGFGRVLFAGDIGRLAYAGQLGVHIRPLDDSPAPGSPEGSELVFGVAAGPRLPVGRDARAAFVLGPEIYGETAFRSFLGRETTGLEALLSGRFEGTGEDGPQLRVKLGAGGGLNPHFGAPEWRMVFGIELFDHQAGRAARPGP